MGGLVGIVNFDGRQAPQQLLMEMAALLAHRGPDGAACFLDGAVGLGHLHLAVIDLTKEAEQPFSSSDGALTIVYNGTIYNFLEIRAELEKSGYKFRSRTDAEVILYAFDKWGEQCLNKFNGMFAFAIWDKRLRRLFLARDRYGAKPLYYCFQKDFFLFASEQKAFAAHPSFRRQLDQESLLEYFTFQNFFTAKTLLKDVRMFPAGSMACLQPEKREKDLSVRQYWDWHFKEPESKTHEQEYVEELRRLLKQAVTRQMVGDAELGAYLSGGLDSGAITSVAAGLSNCLKSFTCGCDMHSVGGLELNCDEREAAEHMSYLFKTEHYEMVLKAGDMERVLPKLAWHMEEPRVGQSYPNYYAAKLASKFVKVVLSGGGGDELFAGYPWRYYRAVVNTGFEHYIDKYYDFWQRLLPSQSMEAVFSPIWRNIRHVRTRDIFRSVFRVSDRLDGAEDYINHSLYFEARTFLHGLLVVEDKLSMAHGLETRLPFLDNDLVDFALTVPVRMKLNNLTEVIRMNENEPGPKKERFFARTGDGKVLLRKTLADFLPPAITQAVKQGFSAPDGSWFKGDSLEYVRTLLYDKKARIYEYMDKKTIVSLMDEHMEGRHNHRLLIWSLLSFEHWLRQYL